MNIYALVYVLRTHCLRIDDITRQQALGHLYGENPIPCRPALPRRRCLMAGRPGTLRPHPCPPVHHCAGRSSSNVWSQQEICILCMCIVWNQQNIYSVSYFHIMQCHDLHFVHSISCRSYQGLVFHSTLPAAVFAWMAVISIELEFFFFSFSPPPHLQISNSGQDDRDATLFLF